MTVTFNVLLVDTFTLEKQNHIMISKTILRNQTALVKVPNLALLVV